LYGGCLFAIHHNYEAVATRTAELTLEQEREKKGKEMETFLQHVLAEKTNLDSYFVSQDSEVKTIEELESLGKFTHVSLEIIQVAGVKEPNGTDALSMDIAVHGTWHDTIRFLDLLESIPTQSTIYFATFSKDSESTSTESTWALDATVHFGLNTTTS